MTRVAPSTVWEEPNRRKATSVGLLAYPRLTTHWHVQDDPDLQGGSFVLRDSRVFLEPWAVSGARTAFFGLKRRVVFLQLPAGDTLDLLSPGATSLTTSRTSTASYLGA